MNQELVHYAVMASPVGRLRIAVSGRGLLALEFAEKHALALDSKRFQWVESLADTQLVTEQLKEYFAGTRQEFTVPLDLRGTDFQRACWNELLAIPYGSTTSYLKIARRVGSPDGMRAVGQANHRNPVAIIVPCHRVITHDGKLGGYGGGLATKEWLLRLEGAWESLPETMSMFNSPA